jgi:hypothetical protein
MPIIYGGKGKLLGGAAVIPWYLAGGIPLANCVAAYQAKGAADLASSYTNLANPGTYNASLGIAPTFDTLTGWTFNGSTQYLKTGIIPLIDQTYSILIRIKPVTTVNVCPAFCRGGANKDFGVFIAGTTYYPHNGGAASIAITSLNGVDATIGLCGATGYRDGLPLVGVIPAGTPPTLQDIFLGAGNESGTPNFYYPGKIYFAAVYNIVLMAAQVLAVSSSMAAL